MPSSPADERALFNWYWGLEDEDGRPRLSLDFAWKNGEKFGLFDLALGGSPHTPSRTTSQKRNPRDVYTHSDEKGSSSRSPLAKDAGDHVRLDDHSPSAGIDWQEPMDEETAFACLQSLPGLESYSDQLLGIRNDINHWKAQGANLQKRTKRLHIAIHGKDDQMAKEFAKLYHAFLTASGVLTGDHESHQTVSPPWRGGKLTRAQGLCLVLEAETVPRERDWPKLMQASNLVFVASYTGDGESGSDEVPFRLDLHFKGDDEKRLQDSIATIQEHIAVWLADEYSKEMHIEGGMHGRWTELFARRLIKRSEGYGHEEMQALLDEELEAVVERQDERLRARRPGKSREVDVHCLTREDLLGKVPEAASAETGPRKELVDLIGLEQVKQSVDTFATQFVNDHYRKMEGKPPLRSGLSRVFIGPPGTGKTTVGKLYGQILSDLKLLNPGGFEFRKASDFIGEYIGKSEKKTRQILDETKGKVLMIDEAYNLDPFQHRSGHGACPYRTGIINTIVEEVQNTADENRCVILCGYKEEMEKMIEHANPGFQRRFPLADAFVFEQFSHHQLEDVLRQQMRKREVTMTPEALKVALETLHLNKQRKNFGNGGEVYKLLDRAQNNYAGRFARITADERRNEEGTCFLPHDVDPSFGRISQVRPMLTNMLNEMVGVDHVRDELFRLIDLATSLRKRGQSAPQYMSFNFVLKGPPGTGKRTIARKFGWLFHSLRLLATDEIIRTSVRELIDKRTSNTYHEQTPSFKNLLSDATGKVLIVEDAHQLFGEEQEQTKMMIRNLREEIVDALNLPEFSQRVVVVLVGTEPKIDRVLESAAGLGRKFTERLQFKGVEADACPGLIASKLRAAGVILDYIPEEAEEMSRMFSILVRWTSWENHRDITDVVRDLVGSALYVSDSNSQRDEPRVTATDVFDCLRRKFSKQLAAHPVPKRRRSAEQRSSLHLDTEMPGRHRRSASAVPDPQTVAQSKPSNSGQDAESKPANVLLIPQTPQHITTSDETSEVLASASAIPVAREIKHSEIATPPLVDIPDPPESIPLGATEPAQDYPEDPPISVPDDNPITTAETLPASVSIGRDLPYTSKPSKAGKQKDRTHAQAASPISTPTSPYTPRFAGASKAGERKDSANFDDIPTEKYKYDQLRDGGYIRLLELEPSQDVWSNIVCNIREVCVTNDEVPEDEAFDALSYTWISQERTRPITCDGKRLMITRSCEQAMRRLRRRKSSCRLWIDVVCIDQESNDDRNQQVALMGEIFRSAKYVFVWLGEDLGLDAAILADLWRLSIDGVDTEDFKVKPNHLTALRAVMKHRWWKRMWTFQEFVLAKRPIFVIGKIRIPWESFTAVLMTVIANAQAENPTDGQSWLKATKNTVIRQLVPEDAQADMPPELEAGIHMLPVWLEVADVLMCRGAYMFSQQISAERRHVYMSHYLLKTRNRQATDPRDNIYGLYYLFRACGFGLPSVNYKLPVTEIYKNVAMALLEQSESWWILNQLLSKRADSDLALPSWCPDFGSRTVWHQGIDLRFSNMHKLTTSLETEEAEAAYRTSVKFHLEPTDNGMITRGVFLWTVAKRTEGMRPHPILDRAFEETFEMTDFNVLEDALDDFFHCVTDWIKRMEVQPGFLEKWGPGWFNEEEGNKSEREMLDAIACAYWRGSWKFIRSFGQPVLAATDENGEPTEIVQEMPDAIAMEGLRFLRLILARVRSCMSPDAEHPCVCGTIEPHDDDAQAAECFKDWVAGQGVEELRYVKYWLYSRAIDHTLFKTNSLPGCRGHFGFCRNNPREGDDIVLLPGLADPAIIRKRGDVYKVIGVTTGLVGPPVVDDQGEEVKGSSYCLGTCIRLWNVMAHEPRTFTIA